MRQRSKKAITVPSGPSASHPTANSTAPAVKTERSSCGRPVGIHTACGGKLSFSYGRDLICCRRRYACIITQGSVNGWWWWMEKEKQVNTQILKKYELCMYGSYCHSSLCILFRIMRIMETKLQPQSSTEHNHYQNQKNKLTNVATCL